MKVLVLGGCGFIGSHIVDALISSGHSLRVFSNKQSNIAQGAQFFQGDFRDAGDVSEALIGMDAVIHCISTTVPVTSTADPVYDIETNLVGTVKLLQLMKQQSISRLVYLSSGGTVYGNPESNPVNEEARLNPISSYGAVKVAIEKFIEISRYSGEINPLILRPSNPYGVRQGHQGAQGLISTILSNVINARPTVIYGDGSVIRDYIYVKDLADFVGQALVSDSAGIYNVGSGVGYSVNQVIGLIEGVTKSPVDTEYVDKRGFDVKEVVLDCQRAKSELGWEATTELSEGIGIYYDWLKDQ